MIRGKIFIVAIALFGSALLSLNNLKSEEREKENRTVKLVIEDVSFEINDDKVRISSNDLQLEDSEKAELDYNDILTCNIKTNSVEKSEFSTNNILGSTETENYIKWSSLLGETKQELSNNEYSIFRLEDGQFLFLDVVASDEEHNMLKFSTNEDIRLIAILKK